MLIIIIMINHKSLKLNNNSDNQEQLLSDLGSTRKMREVYIVPSKDIKPQSPKQSNYQIASSYKKYKTQFNKNAESLPPKSTLFKRTKQTYKHQNNKDQTQSQNHKRDGSIQFLGRTTSKVFILEKKLAEETKEKQQLIQRNMSYQLKIITLQEEINRLRHQKKQLQKKMFGVEKQFEQNKVNLCKAREQIQQLNKNLKQNKINLKSLTNLKNIQNQLQYLQQRNKKLSIQNQSLNKLVRKRKIQFNKQSTSESQTYHQNDSLPQNQQYQHQPQHLPHHPRHHEFTAFIHPIPKNQQNHKSSSREKWLESNLFQLQKKLYQKQNEINKLQIQLNCINRKRTLSIDEVKNKKDQQIKDLRQKFIKISKDLKEAKDKMQKNEKSQRKKSIKEKHNLFCKKIASSKHIGLTSESQEVTFELSSEV